MRVIEVSAGHVWSHLQLSGTMWGIQGTAQFPLPWLGCLQKGLGAPQKLGSWQTIKQGQSQPKECEDKVFSVEILKLITANAKWWETFYISPLSMADITDLGKALSFEGIMILSASPGEQVSPVSQNRALWAVAFVAEVANMGSRSCSVCCCLKCKVCPKWLRRTCHKSKEFKTWVGGEFWGPKLVLRIWAWAKKKASWMGLKSLICSPDLVPSVLGIHCSLETRDQSGVLCFPGANNCTSQKNHSCTWWEQWRFLLYNSAGPEFQPRDEILYL